MRPSLFFAALIGSTAAIPFNVFNRRAPHTKQGFTIAKHGDIDDVEVTEENTLNGTYNKNTHKIKVAASAQDPVVRSLPLEFVNNYSGGAINAYITGLDSDNRVCFVLADGTLFYPSAGGSTTPVPISENIAIPLNGDTTNIILPIAMSSGRVYFAEGSLQFFMVDTGSGDGVVQPSVTNLADPNVELNWGFVELTLTTEGAVYANISFVDFVGIILGMQLSVNDGTTQTTAGLTANAVVDICNDLQAQANADGFPWASLCVANANGVPVRVLSPRDYADINPSAFESYWTSYVDQVWAKYSSQPLQINTQTDAGVVSCSVSGDLLNCDGDNRAYAKPNAVDIWGCDSGPFGIIGSDNAVHVAIVARLCAAFVRSTLLLDGGDVQPSLDSSNYYTVEPTNHYSRILHKYEEDGRGYAFPYDDVNPDGNENASGLLSSGNPGTLSVWVGGPPA